MTPFISSPPLSTEVAAALARLEAADKFDGLQGDFDVVRQEATRRAWPAFIAMTPGLVTFVILYGGAQAFGWLRLAPPLNYFGWLLIVPVTALITNALRGAATVKDEQRIGAALNKWRADADRRVASSGDAGP